MIILSIYTLGIVVAAILIVNYIEFLDETDAAITLFAAMWPLVLIYLIITSLMTLVEERTERETILWVATVLIIASVTFSCLYPILSPTAQTTQTAQSTYEERVPTWLIGSFRELLAEVPEETAYLIVARNIIHKQNTPPYYFGGLYIEDLPDNLQEAIENWGE